MKSLTIENLLEDCCSGNPARQAPAIMTLQELEVYEAVPVLIDLLTSPEWNIRSLAAEALGWLGSENSELVGSALIKLLADPDSDVRDEVVNALSRLRYTRACESVQYLLHSDPDWVVRASAAEALADLAEVGNKNVLAALESALDDQMEPVRSYAAYSIGLLGTPELLQKLEMYLSSEESLDTKAEILAAKYRLGSQDDLKRFLSLLKDANEHLLGVIITILEDLINYKAPLNLVNDLALIDRSLQQIPQVFSVEQKHLEAIINKVREFSPDDCN